MRWCLAALLTATLLPISCDTRQSQVSLFNAAETPPGLDEAGEMLMTVAESVVLVEVRVTGARAEERRRTVGAVIGKKRVITDTRAVLPPGGESTTGDVHGYSIEVVVHPGQPDERRYPATALHQSSEGTMAVLSIETGDPPPLPLGDDVPDDTRVFLISTSRDHNRLRVTAGRVLGYEKAPRGRRMRHTAADDLTGAGLLIGPDGAVIGLQVAGEREDRLAIPAVEIDRWLATPHAGDEPPSQGSHRLTDMLRQTNLHFREASVGGGYVVEPRDQSELHVQQSEGLIVVSAELGTLHTGDAIEALRANYSDPLGGLALRPAGDAEQLVWVARLPLEYASAGYLSYALRVASTQISHWRRLQSGLEPDYLENMYPDGDERAQSDRLAEIVAETSLSSERTDEVYELQPQSPLPVFVKVFRGMAYVHAYSGGLPGEGPAEREQSARALLRRNWRLRLGRLALDSHLDLAWEAQVPLQHLTPDYLEALVQTGASQIAALEREYGDVPFNQ